MIQTATAVLSHSILAKQLPSIYAIFLPEFKAIYIGQTVSPYGPLGRLSQHLSDSMYNTCLQRLCSLFRLEYVMPENVHLCAVTLVDINRYKQEKDLLDALECLVQDQILDYLCKTSTPIIVISRVRRNPQCEIKRVQSDAKSVAAEFIANLPLKNP